MEADPRAALKTALDGRMTDLLADWARDSDNRDAFYLNCCRQGRFVPDGAIVALEYIQRRYPPSVRLCEVGTGLGAFAFLCAAAGLDVAAVEAAPSRRRVAVMLAEALAPEIRGHVEILGGYYPRAHPGLAFDVLIASNVVNSVWNELRMSWREIIGPHDAVLDLRVWDRCRETDAEIMELVNQIRAEGYTAECVAGTVWAIHNG